MRNTLAHIAHSQLNKSRIKSSEVVTFYENEKQIDLVICQRKCLKQLTQRTTKANVYDADEEGGLLMKIKSEWLRSERN